MLNRAGSVPRFQVVSSAAGQLKGVVPPSEMAWQPLEPASHVGTGTRSSTSLAAVRPRLVTVTSYVSTSARATVSGLAVITSGRYPAFLGWIGFLGGLGSLIAGPFMFFDVAGLPIGLSIISAVIISIYMIGLGVLLWREPV